MKNVVIGILSLAVVGLGATVVVLVTGDEPELTPEPVVEPTMPAPVPLADVVIPEPEVSMAVPEEAGPDGVQLEKAHDLIGALYEANQALEEDSQPSLVKGIQQIVESPELKGMIRKGMGDRVRQSHAALFRRLGLSEDQEAAMTELLVEQNIEGIATGVNWMTGNYDESAAQILAAREQMHEQIREQFGPEALKEYEYWEVTKNERESVERFNRRLGEAPLDETASDWLVDMMYDTRGEFEELDYLSQPENFDPTEMTPEYREEVMGQVGTLHEQYLEEAAVVLTEDQLTTYEANLARERQQLNGFLQFTHGMANRRNQAAE